MSALEKSGQAGLFDFQAPSAFDGTMFYSPFPQGPYDHHPLLQPGNVGDTDFQFVPGNENFFEKSFDQVKASAVDTQQSRDGIVGTFAAPDLPPLHSSQGAPTKSLKRKASRVDEIESSPAHKKVVTAQVQVQDPNGDYYDLSGQTSPYSPFVPTPTGSNGFPSVPQGVSPRPFGHHYSTSNASQVSLAAPSPHTPAFSPCFTVKSEQSPTAPMTPIPRPHTSSPLKSSAPKLVRTSTIQHSPTVFGPSMSMAQTQNFNPYTMPHKATLKLKGDLDSMTKDWTEDERDARRRLVVFERHQLNSTITASFKGIAPQERQPSSICISCIWWKEKDEYYVTSVDTIYLLESLVGVRFTVEEKNRIRRNLEGFRPMTVSKAKTDSEEFFKVIMGFPHPKPRNIEKDVKVFPWKILVTALKKIISKYSASYSSTAASLHTPVPSTYQVDTCQEYHCHPASPHTEYVTTPGFGYPVSIDAGYVSQPMQMRMPVVPQQPELQLQVPDFGPMYDVGAQFAPQQMVQMPQGTMAMPPTPMTAPVSRMPPWEYGSYVHDNSPATTAPQSAPPIAYPRGNGEFMAPMHYQFN